ncbi:MAG: hypothetical protein ACREIL_04855 [Nitrospiraceae bacterium]
MISLSRRRAGRPSGMLARLAPVLAAALLAGLPWAALRAEPPPPPPIEPGPAAGDLQVEIKNKGLGKEVSIKRGDKEWFMMIEVTADNTVVVRQEKDHETFLVDESENHDRAMTPAEVDAAIEAFINSVKTRAKRK